MLEKLQMDSFASIRKNFICLGKEALNDAQRNCKKTLEAKRKKPVSPFSSKLSISLVSSIGRA